MRELIILLIFIISLTIVFNITLKKKEPTDRFDICIYSYIVGVLTMAVAMLFR